MVGRWCFYLSVSHHAYIYIYIYVLVEVDIIKARGLFSIDLTTNINTHYIPTPQSGGRPRHIEKQSKQILPPVPVTTHYLTFLTISPSDALGALGPASRARYGLGLASIVEKTQ